MGYNFTANSVSSVGVSTVKESLEQKKFELTPLTEDALISKLKDANYDLLDTFQKTEVVNGAVYAKNSGKSIEEVLSLAGRQINVYVSRIKENAEKNTKHAESNRNANLSSISEKRESSIIDDVYPIRHMQPVRISEAPARKEIKPQGEQKKIELSA